MTDYSSIQIGDSSSLCEVSGETHRPGGLELTVRALEFCDFAPRSRLLDIGCGMGATQALLSSYGFQAYGIDASSLILKKNPFIAYLSVQADGQSIPMAEGSLDGVFLECTLSVVTQPLSVLLECFRLLKPGGALILTDLYARNVYGLPPLRAAVKHLCFNSIWSSTEIRSVVQSAGLKILLWEDHSKAIRDFIGKTIFTHGSMGDFWEDQLASSKTRQIDPLNFQLLLSRARIGYFMLIAQKYSSG